MAKSNMQKDNLRNALAKMEFTIHTAKIAFLFSAYHFMAYLLCLFIAIDGEIATLPYRLHSVFVEGDNSFRDAVLAFDSIMFTVSTCVLIISSTTVIYYTLTKKIKWVSYSLNVINWPRTQVFSFATFRTLYDTNPDAWMLLEHSVTKDDDGYYLFQSWHDFNKYKRFLRTSEKNRRLN